MRSDPLKKGPARAPARAMLKGAGYSDADLEKPFIGVANTWTEVTPCNVHLRALAEKVKQGIREAGGTPVEFNTIAVSDGISMGTEGMRASLVSREVIADSIELFAMAHMLDGIVALSGCDKTLPGTVMALARLDVPSLMLYGGPIAPGRFEGRDVTIQDVFEAVGAHAAGKMTESDLRVLEDHACPGAGSCGGQYTANTMATAIAFLGMSPMGANEVPATDPRKDDVARACGKAVMRLVAEGPAPALLHHARVDRERHRARRRRRPARPTRSCTFSPSPTKRASPWGSTTSIPCRRARRSSRTSSRAGASRRSTCTARAASAFSARV